MRTHRSALFGLFLGLATSSVAVSQLPRSGPSAGVPSGARPADQRLGDAFVVAKSSRVWQKGDEVHGVGPGYAVRFAPGGFEFAPAVTHAHQRVTLDFRLLSTGRRGGDAQPATPATPRFDEETVHYLRQHVMETYDVRSDGVKQSFVFRELPAGSGDLVVRGRIDTELPLARATETEVVFERPGIAGVRIGAVKGIDAHGATAPGLLRFAHGELEMSLPASFVNRAALPLVLDPLVSSSVALPTSGGSSLWDVAYSARTDRYVILRGETGSGAGSNRGYTTYQYVLGNGTLGQTGLVVERGVGGRPPPAFHTSSVASGDPAGPEFWVVGLGRLLLGRYPFFGALGSGQVSALYAYSGAVYCGTAMGGYAGDADSVIAVTEFCGSIWVSGLGRYTAPFSPGNGGFPAISRSGGGRGRYLVSWSNRGNIFGAIVDSQPVVLVPQFLIADSGLSETCPSVDGDGTNWVVAYESRLSSSNTDIHCRGVTYDPRSGTAYLTPQHTVVANDARRELGPSVAWMGDSYLIGYRDETRTPNYDVHVVSLESFDCDRCEGLFAVETSSAVATKVRIASQRAGGGGDEALIVWSEQGGSILARRFRAQDGLVADLGGGCGSGGQASATCARRASTFGLRVQHAAPVSPTWLVVGFGRVNFPCGPCTLVPNPLALLATITDAHGDASTKFALGDNPSLLGLKLVTQWIVAGTHGPCGAGLHLSNALEVEIQ